MLFCHPWINLRWFLGGFCHEWSGIEVYVGSMSRERDQDFRHGFGLIHHYHPGSFVICGRAVIYCWAVVHWWTVIDWWALACNVVEFQFLLLLVYQTLLRILFFVFPLLLFVKLFLEQFLQVMAEQTHCYFMDRFLFLSAKLWWSSLLTFLINLFSPWKPMVSIFVYFCSFSLLIIPQTHSPLSLT